MIKGAVFDLDHTLFDRYETQKICIQGFCRHFDVAEGMTDEKVASIVEYGDKRYNHLGWKYIFRHVTDSGVFKTEPPFEEYCSFLQTRFTKHAVPYPFTRPMLTELKEKGIKLGLITNGNPQIQWSKIKMLDMESIFDEIIVAAEIGAEKPDVKPFEVMAERLGLEPQELIYVGDNPKNDVDPSRKAGYTPVWVKTMGYWLFPDIEVPEFCIKDVREVPNIVKILNGDLA